jgi:putative ABC transport system permease protein
VALLVGSLGIANVMAIGVLERRGEIGLRRALGATRRHVRWQFLVESVLLSAGGGVLGAALGAAVTVGYPLSRDWTVVVPGTAVAAGLVASVLSGAVAGSTRRAGRADGPGRGAARGLRSPYLAS